MKLGFALLAAGAAALSVRENLTEWAYDECLDAWWQEDLDNEDCGWWYSIEEDDDWADDWWMSCDEYEEAECWWDLEDLDDLEDLE